MFIISLLQLRSQSCMPLLYQSAYDNQLAGNVRFRCSGFCGYLDGIAWLCWPGTAGCQDLAPTVWGMQCQLSGTDWQLKSTHGPVDATMKHYSLNTPFSLQFNEYSSQNHLHQKKGWCLFVFCFYDPLFLNQLVVRIKCVFCSKFYHKQNWTGTGGILL